MKSSLAVVAVLLVAPTLRGQTTRVVTSSADTGAGTLRSTIAAAASGDSIHFDAGLSGQTIDLTNGPLVVNKSLVIDASALPGGLTIDAGAPVTSYHAIGIPSGFDVTLDSLTITGGTAASLGGGIVNAGTLTVRRCTITGNSAPFGGGIANNAGTLVLDHTTVAGNFASISGGIDNYNGPLTLHHSTISANHATTSPGGVSSSGGSASLTVDSSIIAGNTAAVGTANLIGSLTGGDGFHLTSGAPLLAPLASYGGPTETMPPLPGSPALDAAAVSDPGGTDQRGQPRFANGQVDLGAVEIQETADTDGILTTLWTLDGDLDGSPGGVEFALGTSLHLSDRNHPANLTHPVLGSGQAVLTFGFNPAAAPHTAWVLKRATHLAPGGFQEIYRYDGPTTIETTGPDISSVPGTTSITVTDQNPPAGSAFYRFEAVHVPVP